MKKTQIRTLREDVISFIVDENRPLKERVRRFLQLARDQFRCSEALMIAPQEPSFWKIFAVDEKGGLRISRRQRSRFDLSRVFKGADFLSHESGARSHGREFLRLFPGVSFLAVPLNRGRGKPYAALGMIRKEGEEFTKGETRQVVAFAGDIPSHILVHVLALEILTRRNRDLTRSVNTKDDHYQMIAHDLKGPIAEILANIDLLKYSPNLSREDREVLDTALCGCNSLYRMVADLLDINKMEGGKLCLSLQTFPLSELIRQKADAMKVLASPKGVVFELREEGKIPPVSGDRELIERVLANLFSNAIAHSYPDQPVVIVTRFQKKEGLIRVSVRNRGKGIPRSYQVRIFKKYGQHYQAGLRKRYSTGLGLPFCKLAVEKHGGKIWVESEEGQGSIFCFTLPARPSGASVHIA